MTCQCGDSSAPKAKDLYESQAHFLQDSYRTTVGIQPSIGYHRYIDTCLHIMHICTQASKQSSIHTGYIQYTADKTTNNKVYSTEMGIKTAERGCLNQSWTTELAEVWLQLTKLGKFSHARIILRGFTMNNRLHGALYLVFLHPCPRWFRSPDHFHLLDGLKPPTRPPDLGSDAWTATWSQFFVGPNYHPRWMPPLGTYTRIR